MFKMFVSAFLGSFAALVIVVIAVLQTMQPYTLPTLLAAHKIIGNPDEARRLVQELNLTPESEVNKTLDQFYENYRSIDPVTTTTSRGQQFFR